MSVRLPWELALTPVPPPWPHAGACCRDSPSEKNYFSRARHRVGGLEGFSPASCTCLRSAQEALRPESDKEEQSEELETNCEQMSGRIIRYVWKAHQDRLMRQKKALGSLEQQLPSWRGRCGEEEQACAGSAPSIEKLRYASSPPAGTPARRHACCSAVVAQQHRIRMHDLNILAPVLPLILQIGDMETGFPLLPSHLWLQTEREEGKVSEQDSSYKG